MVGARAGEYGPEVVLGPGVDDLLPFAEVLPMLYDCEMALLAKNEVAAANIPNDGWR